MWNTLRRWTMSNAWAVSVGLLGSAPMNLLVQIRAACVWPGMGIMIQSELSLQIPQSSSWAQFASLSVLPHSKIPPPCLRTTIPSTPHTQTSKYTPPLWGWMKPSRASVVLLTSFHLAMNMIYAMFATLRGQIRHITHSALCSHCNSSQSCMLKPVGNQLS